MFGILPNPVMFFVLKKKKKKERKDLKQLMNSSQALPFSPGRIDAWLFVGLFQAPPS